jgi:hypothetical protein
MLSGLEMANRQRQRDLGDARLTLRQVIGDLGVCSRNCSKVREDATMNKTTILAGALVGFGFVSSAQAANYCDALWYQRNTIFKAHGYCFHTARGHRAFSNNGCRFGDGVPLSAKDQAVIADIQALERSHGCTRFNLGDG